MTEFLIILIAILLSAFFSGMGIAFISINKMSLEVEKQKSTFSSNLLTIFSSGSDHLFLTIRFGFLFSLVLAGIAFANLSTSWFSQLINNDIAGLIFEIILAALTIILIDEFLFKTIFRINANNLLKIFIGPLLFCYLIIYPFASAFHFISKIIVRLFSSDKINSENVKNLFSIIDLDNFESPTQKIGENEVETEETEIELFRNALDFQKVKVRDCLVPRTELVAVDDYASIDELKSKFIETGYSKILVYNENVDNIIGYVHSSQMFKNPSDIKSVINSISYVPETMMASDLLSTFSQKHKSIAIVVDEYGGTSGMITTEDILEEIFGEIEDEHDTDDLIIKKIKENEWILSARHEISLLNVKFHFNLPEGDEYDTIAGLILNHHENIPKKNSIITIGNYEFRILKVSKTRIELVLMKIVTSN